MILLLTLLAAVAASEPAAQEDAPAQTPAPLLRSSVEARLWRDLDARLADPAAFQTLIDAEAPSFYEGRLFPYVLPVLALANRAQEADASRADIHLKMSFLLDRAITETARRLRAPSPEAIPEIPGYGTWQGQLALALGAWRLAGGDDRYEALHGRLCTSLLAALQAREGAPIDAYPALVWTFDTVPVLLALRLRDRTDGLEGVDAATQAHFRWLDANLDPATGLPPSRVELDSGRIVEGPRGADLGMRITLVAQLDRERAQALYARYVAHFSLNQLGLSGFAEWPDGQVGRPDADSGPVIAGLGMSSTGFGLTAARIMRDEPCFVRLDAQLANLPRLLGPLRPLLAPQARALGMNLDTDAYVTGLLLGDLAMLWGLSWTDWGVGSG